MWVVAPVLNTPVRLGLWMNSASGSGLQMFAKKKLIAE
jgi:hypothetical protein